jgi:hypothetical protein
MKFQYFYSQINAKHNVPALILINGANKKEFPWGKFQQKQAKAFNKIYRA